MNFYKGLYSLQDNFISEWRKLDLPFYLTGGTALSRYYLNHRFSDDLDFFLNSDSNFNTYIDRIGRELVPRFEHQRSDDLVTDDFFRIFISQEGLNLKIEFVNDVPYYIGQNQVIDGLRVDNVKNILCNKITAIVGRDEPKDLFDVIHIALNYHFNWKEIFQEAKEKSMMNEIDILNRIYSFPIDLFENVKWRNDRIRELNYSSIIRKLAEDFSMGANNSLNTEMLIDYAEPRIFQ